MNVRSLLQSKLILNKLDIIKALGTASIYSAYTGYKLKAIKTLGANSKAASPIAA